MTQKRQALLKKKKLKRIKTATVLAAVLLVAAAVFMLFKGGSSSLQKSLYPLKYAKTVTTCCRTNNLEEPFIFAVIKCESNFDPNAVSSAGAKGLMQIMPDTFAWLKTKTGEELSEDKLFEPEVSIKYGCLLYSMFIEQFGTEREAVAAYHAGPNNVKKWLKDKRYSSDGKTLSDIPFSSTKFYVDKVMETKEIYQKLYY